MSLLGFALSGAGHAQTYQVAPNASTKPQSSPGSQQTQSQSLGFGSNIQNARLGRAAELALQRGDHALALNYAQRAAQAAPNDPQLWFLVGYAARLDGKTQQSADAYKRGLALKPGSLEGLSGLAQTYSVMGRTGDAETLLKQVIASDPRRADDALLLGDLYMRSGDYQGALEWLNKAERAQPGARSELLLAICYQHLKQLDRASHYLNLAKKRAPDNPEVQRSLAAYYRETGNYPAAIAALQSIKGPKADVVAELAYTYQLDGKLRRAARLYAQSADARPKDMGLQLSAAQAQVAVGSTQDADRFLQRAAAIDANYYRLHAIRGEIAQMQERDSDAVTEYSAALAQLPADPIEGPLYGIQLHMDLMTCYRNLGDDTAAHQQLALAQSGIDALHEHGPDRAQFLRLRASIAMNAGNLDAGLKDMKEALAIAPTDPSNLQLDGDLLMKAGRTEEAISTYKRILTVDPKNRFALTSLGYASRVAGHDAEAEKYFTRLAQAYPSLYVPYLALGDLDSTRHNYKKANAYYAKAFALSPHNPLITAGGMNSAIEAHNMDLAGTWLDRATPKMRQDPQMLRETERYLSFKGDYAQSAQVGEQAIKVLPHDRDVIVYLGYDLLHLEKYNELLQLTEKYSKVLPHEPDLPLLAGYVHKHDGQMAQAERDFTEALERDPNIGTAYVNRGFIMNDLHQPAAAASDFEAAIKLDPKDGEAHLGLAYADLDLHRPQAAVRQSQLVEQDMGNSKFIHLIRATAYGRMGMLSRAGGEYRAAMKFSPDEGSLYLGLADTLFAQRRYHEAIDALQTAQKLSPNDADVDALLARSYAHLQDREQTLHYVQLAEQKAQQTPATADNAGSDHAKSMQSGIYVATGRALSTIGEQKAAMERFRKALTAPNSDRINVRLAIAQLMAQQDHSEDAQRQIALAMMEGETGETEPPTGEQYIAAADVFREMHEYPLSQDYLQRAKTAGAPDISVRIGMANTYLALGDTARAQGELAAIRTSADSEPDYQYLLAEANIYRQEHQSTQSLTAFAQAADDAGEDQTAEQNLLAAGADEGYRVNPYLSLLSNFSVQPIFEDTTVYVLDSKLDQTVPVPPADISKLPLPRYSLQIQETAAYHLHLQHLPTLSGFFQLVNTHGTISVPATSSIERRATTDYSFNLGVDPTVHVGRNVLTFNTGVQGTVRRDALSPLELNQNLFRAFTYISTSSFFNAVSASGYVIFEEGPFTESNIHSRAWTGAVDFRVGQPWSKTALVTGWGMNDQKFNPVGIEDYYTSSYIGLTSRFSDKWNAAAILEDLRAWRIVSPNSGIAQDLRPTGTLNYLPTRHWAFQVSTAYSSTRAFHVYDATQNGMSVSYTRPFHRNFNDPHGEEHLGYPISFAAGFQQQTFFNFNYGKNQTFQPYLSITIF